MKLELKKIKVNLAFSEETTMFNAELFVDGKLVAYAKNDGHGGSTHIEVVKGQEDAFDKASSYAKSLPPIKSTFTNDLAMDLEFWINIEVDNFVNERELTKIKKKVEKACLSNICWGSPNYHEVRSRGFTIPINIVLMTPNGKKALKTLHEKILSELKEGEVIFNTNLTEL